MATPVHVQGPNSSAGPMRFCPRCGQYLADRDAARFCCRCGLAQVGLPPVTGSRAAAAGSPVAQDRARVLRSALVPPLPVAGFQYYDGPLAWDRLGVGDPLELVRESHNRYDPWAVSVQWHGVKLGYVPRQVSEEISRLLEAGRDLRPVLCDKTERRPFGYHSLRFQVDLPLGHQLWKWPT